MLPPPPCLRVCNITLLLCGLFLLEEEEKKGLAGHLFFFLYLKVALRTIIKCS